MLVSRSAAISAALLACSWVRNECQAEFELRHYVSGSALPSRPLGGDSSLALIQLAAERMLSDAQAVASYAAGAKPRGPDHPGSRAYDGPGPCAAAAPYETELSVSYGGHASYLEPLSTAHRNGQRRPRRGLAHGGSREGLDVTLELFVTLPACSGNSGGDRGPPFPVLFFFNGFQVA